MSRRGKGWGVGVGGRGGVGIKYGKPLARSFQDWESSLCCYFFFWSVVQINEKYNVDYSFECGGFRGFNANK